MTTIESAIKQKIPFKNEHQRAIVNLIFTTNSVQNEISDLLKPFELTMQQYNVLRILRGAGAPISTCVIRERLLDKMSDTSRIVERLFKKGLVGKAQCPSDRRLVDVSINEKGTGILFEMDKIMQGNIGIIFNLNEAEVQQLNELLNKIRG